MWAKKMSSGKWHSKEMGPGDEHTASKRKFKNSKKRNLNKKFICCRRGENI
jgi:hypothetical protein